MSDDSSKLNKMIDDWNKYLDKLKQEIQLILRDYKQTMTKDLEQALENLHDEIESDKE